MHSSFSWFLSFSINFEIFIVKFVKNKKQSPFVLLRNIPGYLYQVFNLFNFWWIFVLFPVIVIQSPNHIRLCNPMDCRMPDLPVPHHLLKFAQVYLHFISDAIQPSHLWCYLLLLSSVFPSIWNFSSESAVHNKWPKYWSFSFSISPSNEYSGLISLNIDWFDVLAVQGTLRSLP